jgi:hypothetical protein
MQAKQSKRCCHPPATANATATADDHGCAAANALTSPSTPPCRRRPSNTAASRCLFLCGNGAGGAKYLEKHGVYSFSKNENNTTLHTENQTNFYFLNKNVPY